MNVTPAYEPPPKRVCEEIVCPVPLDGLGLHRFVWSQWIYRGRVVAFSIEQQYRSSIDDPWKPVYRVDTSHGEVHDHTYGPEGEQRRRVLEQIPAEGWDTVDAWFGRMLEQVSAYANERLRKWMQ